MPIGLEKNHAAQPLINPELPQSNSDKHLKQESVSDGRKYLVLIKTKGVDENIKTELKCTEVKSYASSAKSIAKFMSSAEGKTQLEGMKPDQLDRVAQYLALNAMKSKPRSVLKKIIHFVTGNHFNSSKHYKAALAEVTIVKQAPLREILSKEPAVAKDASEIYGNNFDPQLTNNLKTAKEAYTQTQKAFTEAVLERHTARIDFIQVATKLIEEGHIEDDGTLSKALENFNTASTKLESATKNLDLSSPTIEAGDLFGNASTDTNTAWGSVVATVKEADLEKQIPIPATTLTEVSPGPRGAAQRAFKSAEGGIPSGLRTHVFNNYEEFSKSLIETIPSIRVSKANSSSVPKSNDLNNNGIFVDGDKVQVVNRRDRTTEDKIDRDGEDIELVPISQIKIGNETYNVGGDAKNELGFYDEQAKRVYAKKDDARNHDIVQTSGGSGKPTLITLTDGSGHDSGARPMAKIVNETAHAHVLEKLAKCKTSHDMLKVQLEGVKEAAVKAFETGADSSTTFIQAAIVGNILTGVSVGDSKIFVLRKDAEGNWKCIDPLKNSKGTLDVKDAGGQLTGLKANDAPNNSDLHKMTAFAMVLEEGDCVMAVSDGTGDNLNPMMNKEPPPDGATVWEKDNPEHVTLASEYAIKKMEEVIKGSKGGDEINSKLMSFIEQNTMQRKLQVITEREDIEGVKGKTDDAVSGWTTIKF